MDTIDKNMTDKNITDNINVSLQYRNDELTKTVMNYNQLTMCLESEIEKVKKQNIYLQEELNRITNLIEIKQKDLNNNQDSTNQDFTNQDFTNQDSTNQDYNNKDSVGYLNYITSYFLK